MDLPDLTLCVESVKNAFNMLINFDKELSEHLTFVKFLDSKMPLLEPCEEGVADKIL